MKEAVCELKKDNIEVWRTPTFFTKYQVYLVGKKGKSFVDASMTRWGVRRIFKRLAMIAQMQHDVNVADTVHAVGETKEDGGKK
jgi:hypothetical protein